MDIILFSVFLLGAIMCMLPLLFLFRLLSLFNKLYTLFLMPWLPSTNVTLPKTFVIAFFASGKWVHPKTTTSYPL